MVGFDSLLTDRNLPGAWDPVTSTIDWCELNYVYTYYIAELWNTLSNIPFILGGVLTVRNSLRRGIPARYIWLNIGGIIIGLGSAGFHGSLRWTWQLLDEFPMIYGTSYVSYLVWDTLPGWEPRWGVWGPLLVVSWSIFATVFYLISKNPIVHEVTFAVLFASNIFRAHYLATTLPEARKKQTLKSLWMGTGIFLLAFIIWIFDTQLCHVWRTLRDDLSAKGLGFLGPLTEGHAWWHLLTYFGASHVYVAMINIVLSVKTSPTMWDYDADSWLPHNYRTTDKEKGL